MIRKQEEVNSEFSKALETVGDGYYVFDGGSILLDALLMVLKEAMNDRYDYIGWWLYEATPDYRIWTNDESKEWCLKEPEALYDYIANECQEDGSDA